MVGRAAESGLQVKAAFENEFSLLNLMVFIVSSDSLLPSTLIQVSSLNSTSSSKLISFIAFHSTSRIASKALAICGSRASSSTWSLERVDRDSPRFLGSNLIFFSCRCNYCFSATDVVMQTELVWLIVILKTLCVCVMIIVHVKLCTSSQVSR